ncbi:hypothetical protein [Vibrio algarum]|uniref:Uncharacterized protein n=1 Tax=Vibrio algarum TaxID=3020714 RepID=A0ABT4YP96_9VIBR|nr:hypothetical protein [Vibrio sp. KJ40-1]MDB1123365.1 hypothetical protein [Vibrio sp. KJ40-1]
MKGFSLWGAMSPNLIELELGKSQQYELAYALAKLKIQSVLSLKTCIALDKLHCIYANGIVTNIDKDSI